MSHLAKLSLAVGLAIAAAVLNAMWLTSQNTPPLFVAAKTELPTGTVIEDAHLVAIPVPGKLETLRTALVPYTQRAILFGVTTSRTYAKGDMVFQRDLQQSTNLSKFEVLGPFKLISVGENFKRTDDEAGEARLDTSGNNVTIAVSANFDEQTRRLLEIVDPQRKEAKTKNPERIIAVQVVPVAEQQKAAKPPTGEVVYQTIALDGIENVPQVLLAGDVIRFVVPAEEAL